MPAHAFGGRKYFAGTFASKICDKKHSTTALSDSVPAAVQHSPRDVSRPDVDHFLEDASKVFAVVGREGSGDVFPDGEARRSVGGAELTNNSS